MSREPEKKAKESTRWLHDLRSPERPVQEAALEELSRYLRRGLARTFGGTSAVQEPDLEDFSQEAIVRILTALETFRGDSRFTTWAMAIALRVAYTSLRRRRTAPVSLVDLERQLQAYERISCWASSEPGRRLELDDLRQALGRAISDRLTERQRTVVLAQLHGIASQRTAEALGITRNALYKLCHDARKKLRTALEEAGFDHRDVSELTENSDESKGRVEYQH